MVTVQDFSELEDLVVVVGAWKNPSSLTVSSRRVDWPELEVFAHEYRAVFKQAEGVESIVQMARMAYQALRMLTCSPVAPREEVTGLTHLVKQCAEFTDSHPEHSVVGSVKSLKDAVELLWAKASPVRQQVVGAISEFGTEREMPWKGQPEVVLVVPPDLVAVSQNFLTEEELEAHVRTPEQLKQRCYRGVVICGDLRTAYRSFWTSPETAARTYGWLVTAPSADRVVLVETPVSTNRIGDLWLLDPKARPTLEVKTTGTVGELVDDPLPVRSPPSVSAAEFDLPASGDKLQAAAQVLLASERSVFFANGVGPQPRLILVEEGEVETKDQVPFTRLSTGDYLVIRVSGSDYEEVKNRAERDLIENKGWTRGDINRARGLVADLKRHLQIALDTKGERAVRAAMIRDGLTESHARTLCRNPLDEHYIAPNSRGFAPLAKAIGATELLGKEQWFRDLRTAHRQAGFGITIELNQRLSENLAWLDELSVKDFAVVDGKNLGTLLIETVAYPAEEGYDVPVTYLGHVVEGNPLRPIEADRLRSMR